MSDTSPKNDGDVPQTPSFFTGCAIGCLIIIAAHGAVSAQTAAEMAVGIRERAGTDIALSVTGIAGPDGGTAEKPVGLVYYGIATAAGVETLERKFLGLDHNLVRERAAMQGLDLIRRAALR